MKNKLIMIFMWIFLLVPCNVVFAEEIDETTGALNIEVSYTGKAEAKTGDVFVISFQSLDGNKEKSSIEIDAGDSSQNGAIVEGFPIGSYKVTEIDFQGENNTIHSFAVDNTFDITGGKDDYILLTIGRDGVELLNEDDYYRFIDYENDESGSVSESLTDDETDADEEKGDSTEEEKVEKPEESEESQEEPKAPEEKPKKKSKKYKREDHKTPLIFLTLLSFGCMIGIYVARKKGYLE